MSPVPDCAYSDDGARPSRLEDMLEYSAYRNPSKTAISYLDNGEHKKVSYLKLNAQVQQLAGVLSTKMLHPHSSDTPYVGLFLDRSVGQVTATFATFIAGAAYVPISLKATVPALRSILEQTQMRTIITDSSQRDHLRSLLNNAASTEVDIVDISEVQAAPAQIIPQTHYYASLASAAYVIFSSGTTGTPKGIIISRLGLQTYCASSNEYHRATSEDKWVRAAAYTFDSSIEELFCSLSVGAEIVIQPRGALSNFPTYLKFLNQVEATALSMTPSLWHQFTNFLVHGKHQLPPSLRMITIGGEAALTTVLRDWRATFGDYPRIINSYGPTEVGATAWEGQENVDGPTLPIGRPLANYSCLVLDPSTYLPVEPGQDGVMFISGPGLAIGYLDEALTRKFFVPNPWAESPEHQRMYNTGDVVRVDEEGVFWFKGRLDNQIKVRGFRVEIEAIEDCLLSHPSVVDAVVIISSEQNTNIINAYVVEDTNSPHLYSEDLAEHCSQAVASYEVPSRFYKIEAMLWTAHGKVDRRALQSQSPPLFPFRDIPASDTSFDDVNPTLADVWSQCLENVRLTNLDAQSNFIHLGGHSLTMLNLAAKIYATLGVEVTVVDLLRNPTLGGMSRLLDRSPAQLPSEEGSDIPVEDGNFYPLSSPQARLYTVQQRSPDSPFFNDGVAVQITGEIDSCKIRGAIAELFRRHSILRTKIVHDGEAQVLQVILPFSEALFDQVYSHERLALEAAQKRAVKFFSQPFDLLKTPPFKVVLLSSGDQGHILVICAHHIVWDGVSDSIFLHELSALYQGQTLPSPAVYHRCTSSTQQHQAEKLSALVQYLDSVPQSLSLPVDFVRPEQQTYSRGRGVHFTINSSVVSGLVSISGGTSVSCMMTAYAAAVHLFAASQQDFVVGVPFANRLSSEAAAAIGFCEPNLQNLPRVATNMVVVINVLPLRVRLDGGSSLSDVHRTISQDLLFIAERQDVPFDELVKSLALNRLAATDSLIQTSFTFQDAPNGNFDYQTSYSRFRLSNGAARTDLMCLVEVSKDGTLHGELEYDSGIFAHESMLSLVSAFTGILEAWSVRPSIMVEQLDLIQKKAHIPAITHLAPTNVSIGTCLVSLMSPYLDHPAVYDDSTGMFYTYQDLFSRAARVQQLVRSFKRDEGVVLLLLKRSVDVIAAQIGVNLAGMAWVPCDVSSSLSRLQDISADANPVCALAHECVLEGLEAGDDALHAPIVLMDNLAYEYESMDAVEPDGSGKAAYIIYTSGSTGRPKGVVIGHESVVSYIMDTRTWARDGEQFHCVLSANVAWDASMMNIYLALTTGGCLKIPKPNGEADGEYLSTLMKMSPVTNFVGGTSAAFKMWLDQNSERPGSFFPSGMRQIILGGDEVSSATVMRVFANAADSPDVEVRQVYGPTEGTIYNSYGILTHSNVERLNRRRRVPIDLTMPHVSMTVANRAGNELPRGFVGEIIIWGSCLFLEYHNLPKMNAQRFLIKDGVRGWRSGDLGRHLPNGQFEILGRMDSMCKVRGGFRVELSEIEAQIRSHSDVDDCCVSLIDVPGVGREAAERQIVAHVIFKEKSDQDDHVIDDWKQAFDDAKLANQVTEEQINLSFDHRGWTSSIDRRKFTCNEMTEWLDTTVSRILELDCFEAGKKPRVLEIGPGTGMILFRIAHLCDTYTGFDILPSAVGQVQTHARTLGLDNVDVRVSPAHLFSQSLPKGTRFDLIICNSVIQYFPSLSYLQTVMDSAGDHLMPGGTLFVGDIRNYGLASQFHVARAISDEPRTISELQNSIDISMRTEQELLVDPSYFIRLADSSVHFETATTVIHRGAEVTDMTLFRYDALLRSNSNAAQVVNQNVDIKMLAFANLSRKSTMDEIVMTSRPVLVQHITNKRIADFHYISTQRLDRLENLDELLISAKHEREGPTAHDPEATIAQLSQQATVRIVPICSLSHPECFDLLIVDFNMPSCQLAHLCFDLQLRSLSTAPAQEACNKSGATTSKQNLSGLYDYLSHRIPSYMVPDYVVPIATLPLTNSHKVNKAKLPIATFSDRFVVSQKTSIEWSAEDEARRPVVQAILNIFASVLYVDKPLSPRDNFFLCGGHSLIATKATSLIRREFGVDLPFTAIIISPTASDLAAQVEVLSQNSAERKVPNVIPLQPRSAARPNAMLFVLPFVAGELDMMPQVVNNLDDGTLGLATYGLVWEPNQDLNTLDKIATAYAKSISAIAGSTLCFLVGWCYGGILANEVARHLPKDTTKVLLLDSPSPAETCLVEPTESDHPSTFIDYVCDALNSQAADFEELMSIRNKTRDMVDREKLTQSLVEAKIDRRDSVRLIAFVRQHIELPYWVTDSDLNRYVLPLADNFEVLDDIYYNHSPASFDTAEMETQVVLNLQYRIPHVGMSPGLGWAHYEVVGSDRYSYGYLPEISSRMRSALRENILV